MRLHTVDGDGGSDHLTIQAAVDAASSGDVILVAAGAYAGFTIRDKSLSVVGDVAADARVLGGIRVQDVAAGGHVLLANLTVSGSGLPGPASLAGLEVADCAGAVRVDGCTLAGGSSPRQRGVHVRAAADVSFVACRLHGASTNQSSLYPRPDALEAVEGSHVTLYECFALGGDGLLPGCGSSAMSGGHGADLHGSTLYAAHSWFQAGRGGDALAGSYFGCPHSGDGGDGLRAEQSSVLLLDTLAYPGRRGSPVFPGGCGECAGWGADGVARRGNTFTDLVTGYRRAVATAIVDVAGTTTEVAVTGLPGDDVLLLVSDRTAPAEYVPAWRGVLLVPRPDGSGATRVIPAGVLPASGQGAVAIDLPPPAPGSEAYTLHVQVLARDVAGRRWLGGARSLTVIH